MAKKKGHKHPPRETVNRDDRYMGMAWMWASMSKDPSTQVGAFIVSADNRPLGGGYNGPPSQFNDQEINWTRPDKYPFIVHAECNAIDHCSEKPKGAILYVTGIPCPACMLSITKAKIARVVYHIHRPDKSSMLARQDEWELTNQIAKMGGCYLEAYKGNVNWLRDWMDTLYDKGVFD